MEKELIIDNEKYVISKDEIIQGDSGYCYTSGNIITNEAIGKIHSNIFTDAEKFNLKFFRIISSTNNKKTSYEMEK